MCDGGRWFAVPADAKVSELRGSVLSMDEHEAREREESAQPAGALRLLGGVASLVASVKVSNLARWALERAALELVTEQNERARAKVDAERAALVTEIRKRRAERNSALAFQLALHEIPGPQALARRLRVSVAWSDLEQIPIGGYGREAEPTEGVVAAYAGRVFVVVQLRKPEGWDPVWCLLSLSGDVCGYTEGGA